MPEPTTPTPPAPAARPGPKVDPTQVREPDNTPPPSDPTPNRPGPRESAAETQGE